MAYQSHRNRRPNGNPGYPVRSVRISDELWERAQRRAAYEGVTMSKVLYQIVEGYAAGLVNLPKVQVSYGTVVKQDGEAV
jgi:hypothetical protein